MVLMRYIHYVFLEIVGDQDHRVMVELKRLGFPDSLVRMYEPVIAGTTSVTYDGGQGVFFPFIDLNAAYSITPALSGVGYADGSSVSSTISLQ